jgi:Leucine-rich repeat (LRR) protein
VNIYSLDLSSNKLSSLAPGMFDSLSNLKTLNADFNEIGNLPADLFKNSKNLESLHLANNNITEIPLNFIASTPALTHAYFGSNLLKSIDFSIFEKSENIKMISFRFGKVARILNVDVIDNLKQLKQVDFMNYEEETCLKTSYRKDDFAKFKEHVRTNCSTV